MRGLLLVAAVAVVAAVMFLPSLLVSSVALGDVNQPTNAAGVHSDGWTDVTVQGRFYLTNAAGPPKWALLQVWENETLGSPSGPILTVLRPATVEGSCVGQLELAPNGPQVDAVTAKSEALTFTTDFGAPTEFKFGHLYLYKDQNYRLSFGVYADGCFGLTQRTLISAFEIMVKFDGSSESYDGSASSQ